MLKGPNGGDVDLIANKSIRSGKIAAYLEMRDQVLVQAQAQIDEIAAGMASALSDRTVAGRAATSGAAGGLRRRHRRAAGRQHDPSDLHRQRHQHAAHRHARAGRRSRPLPLPRHGDDRSERQGGRHRFLRRACLDRQPAQRRLLAPRHCNSPIRPARRCACSTMAAPNTVDVDARLGDHDHRRR